MTNDLIYYINDVPITGGAYLKPDYTQTYLSKTINFSIVFLNILLVILIAYFVYTLLTLLYKKYKHITFLIEDTNKKINNINNYIETKSLERNKPSIKRLQLKAKPKEDIYIVNEDGVVVAKEKTEE